MDVVDDKQKHFMKKKITCAGTSCGVKQLRKGGRTMNDGMRTMEN